MAYKTFGTLQDEVENELDLQDEEFIDPTEMLAYFSEAVRKAESQIHMLGREAIYFKKRAFLTLTNGSTDVAMPTDIYPWKILSIVYANGSKIYEVKRQRRQNFYEEKETLRVIGTTNDFYEYDILNASSSTYPIITLTPASKESSTDVVVIEYIREANKMTSTAIVCDIPFEMFIKKYVIWKCYKKEGHPNTGEAKADLDEEQANMVSTLSVMVPDDNNKIELDLTTYQEIS